MKCIINSKVAVSVLFAACVGAFTAQADLLLYDGFATTTDSQNRAAYQTSEERMSLQGDNAKSTAYTTGLSSDKPWSETSTVVYTFKNKGLSLPTAFADGTGDQFTARGGGAGYMNSDSGSDKRAKNRALAYTMPTSGTLYYRCLMKVDSEAYSTLQTGSDWYYQGTGLSTVSAVNKYDNADDLKNNGFRLGFTGRSGVSPKRVDLGINLGGKYHTVLEGISAGTTYIAIVELNYNTAKARVYATSIADYSKTFSWTVENLDIASAVSGSAMKVMFLDGHYKTGGGYVVFDEIAAGTILSDVAVVTPSTTPQLGAVSLTRTGAATYAVSAEVLENAADTVSWIAADGTAATTNAFATAVATNTTASGSVSGLASDKTYQVSVLAESAGGSDEKVASTIYTGAL